MTLFEFNALTADEKAKILLQAAVLAIRDEPGIRIFLHQVFSFYVEAYFDLEKWEVIRFEISEDTNILEPYLESIDISDAFSFSN